MNPQYAYQTAPANFMPMMMAGGGLADAAQQLQGQGRGGDSMLVHMTPGEVRGLQALAMAQGGSLTINPTTGLPEANFLKRLLPTIIGAGLTYFSGGAINPAMAGMMVGGFEGVRTGDLGRGIMAGLGAFGGAGLGASLAGASSVGAQALGQTAAEQSIANQAAAAGIAPSEIAREMASGFAPQAGADIARQSATQQFAKQGLGSQLKGSFATLGQPGGFSNLGSNLASQYGGKYGVMAAALPPAMELSTSMTPKMQLPTPEKSNYAGPYVPNPRNVRFPGARDRDEGEFNYFTPTNPYPGFQLPMFAAEGGLMDTGENPSEELAVGGLTALAGGRFLNQGLGDGTSDSYPAVIGNKQPARLADGEFVVDARTVSELGNGSSKAGAKKLYAMMDRVHKARKKAGRGQDSKAERYIPA